MITTRHTKKECVRYNIEITLLNKNLKKNTHLALDDFRESIAELAYYREHFIRLSEKTEISC